MMQLNENPNVNAVLTWDGPARERTYEKKVKRKQDYNVGFVFDTSGSMCAQNKLGQTKDFAEDLTNNHLGEGDQVAVVGFASKTNTVLPLTPQKERLPNALRALNANGSTAFYDAVREGMNVVANQNQSGRYPMLIFLTDGRDNASRNTNFQKAQQMLKKPSSHGFHGFGNFHFVVITVGSDADITSARELCNCSHGYYFHAPEPKDLKHCFQTVIQTIKQTFLEVEQKEMQISFKNKKKLIPK